jgi:hypothetical protein
LASVVYLGCQAVSGGSSCDAPTIIASAISDIVTSLALPRTPVGAALGETALDVASGSASSRSIAIVNSALRSSTAGFTNITNKGSSSLNLQASGGSVGAQAFFNALPKISETVITRVDGVKTATLLDGSQVTFYPVSTSGGVPTVQIFRTNGTYESTKIRF